jgi:hypothetical protein
VRKRIQRTLRSGETATQRSTAEIEGRYQQPIANGNKYMARHEQSETGEVILTTNYPKGRINPANVQEKTKGGLGRKL